jgi:hypothetical protein
LKAELGRKNEEKEKEEEASENYCSLKVPIDHKDKLSKSYTVEAERYYSGPPQEFLKWRFLLVDHIKNNGYENNAYNIMDLDQTMLAGRSLKAFINKNHYKMQITG